jgi:DNA repair protein RadC
MNLSKVCEVKLTYKSIIKPLERPKINSSIDVYEILKNHVDFMEDIEFKEKFFVLILNRNNKLMSITKISEGTTTGCLVDVKHVMQTAILQNASGIILAHNHQSGNLYPSQLDRDITFKIKQGANFFDIKVCDHLILTSESYYSFADDGEL